MKYTLTGSNGDRVVVKTHHNFLIGVYWTWFTSAALPAINPLATLEWTYRKNT